MIKKDGKMVPAEFKDGKWVAIEGASLAVEGEKLVVKKKQEESKEH